MRLFKMVPIAVFVFLISAPLVCAQQDSEMIVTSPTTQDLYAITPGGMFDMNIAWSVGGGGTILQWDGDQTWDLEASPTTADLYSVSMASDSDAWAVGGNDEG